MNRLAQERSPYLLQHAGNPVDWYPWGSEAFDKARGDNKPIFLSVGYSTCHWCHVMEHESFENAEIARLLNERFVSIKVDREERPDVDRVYMTFVQSTTGSGGWPMSVFLTPELKPFYGGTYFPPLSRWGRPGFLDLLQEIARVWTEDRARVDYAAAELFDRLKSVAGADARTQPESAIAGPDALAEAVEQFQAAFDRRRGGFGDAPKFPRPSELFFLLRAHERTGSPAPLLMVTDTLRAMALGGMRDHVGGGFHRYSVDGDWRVPHFEKMLYDQAQLVLAYLEASQAVGTHSNQPGAADFFASVAEDTLSYVARDMRDKDGGFFSAEDADSVPAADAGHTGPPREGAFYVWTEQEIDDLLGSDADIVRRRFGIEPGGNAPEDPQGEFTGQNILYTAQSIHDIVARSGKPAEEVMAALARARQRLFDARNHRPRPHLDDKILTSWNGLMIAAFARAARVLPERPGAAEWARAARRAAAFIRARLWTSDRGLLRRYRDGEASIAGYAEDYACLIWGLLELFQTDGDAAWLEWARDLQAEQDARFWDDRDGGWFSTTGTDPSVLLRLKEDYDGAEPSASSVSVMNVLTLSHLLDLPDARAKAGRTLSRYGPRAGRAARAIPMMLAGLAQWQGGMSQIVVLGSVEETVPLRAEIARHYLPFAIVIPVQPGDSQQKFGQFIPAIGAMHQTNARATAFVCRDFACQAPVSDPAELGAQLTA